MTSITWSGQTWTVKPAGGPSAPGPNYWDDSSSAATVDANGYLNLSVKYDGTHWRCVELDGSTALGYGKYQWVVDATPDPMTWDQNVVLGLFTWDNGAATGANRYNRELDIEFSKWGSATSQTSPSFSNQPAASYPGTPTTLAASASNSATSIQVTSIADMPASGAPFTLVIDQGSASEEHVSVYQGYTGTGPYTFANCVRGQGGLPAVSHLTGRPVYAAGPETSYSAGGLTGNGPYTCTLIWQANQAYFNVTDSNGVICHEHVVAGVQVPTPGNAMPRMNLWLLNTPSNGQPLTLKLHSFAFTASTTYTLGGSRTSTTATSQPPARTAARKSPALSVAAAISKP